MRLRQTTLAVLATVTLSSTALAQRVAPLVLRLNAGTRAVAMGNAGVTGRDDDVIFYGPAQLGVARGTSAAASFYGRASRGLTVSSAARLGSGGFGIGAMFMTYESPGAYPFERDALSAPGPSDASATVLVAGVAQTYWGFRFGASGKVASEDYGPGRRAFAAADLGVARDVEMLDHRFTVALSVQNIGKTYDAPGANGTAAQFQDTRLPMRAQLGASGGMQVGALDLAAAASVTVPRDGVVETGGGLELGYSWLDGWNVYLRGGARTPHIGEEALTAGSGISLDRLSLDYALETLSEGRVSQRISVRVR